MGAENDTHQTIFCVKNEYVLCLGWEGRVVFFVVLVSVIASSGRVNAVASPRPSVAKHRMGPTSASARRPGTVRMNTCDFQLTISYHTYNFPLCGV